MTTSDLLIWSPVNGEDIEFNHLVEYQANRKYPLLPEKLKIIQ